jgi:hypothetical protein
LTQFDRAAAIDIELTDGTAVRAENLRITFNVEKTRGSATNAIKMGVYNLSKDTRAKIKQKDSYVRLMAGYNKGTGLELLFAGHAQFVLHSHQPPDVITQLECQDGVKELRETRVNLSFGQGVAGSKVMDAIAAQFGFPILNKQAIKGNFPNGFSYVGPARAALDKVSKRFNLEWTIQNGNLVFAPLDGNNSQPPVPLSVESGLIGNPSKLYYTASQLDGSLNAHKSLGKAKKEADIVATGWRVTSLLLPKALPNGRISIDALEIPGGKSFRIESVKHSGDTRGQDWYTDIDVVEQ